jgi:hypothetical protein
MSQKVREDVSSARRGCRCAGPFGAAPVAGVNPPQARGPGLDPVPGPGRRRIAAWYAVFAGDVALLAVFSRHADQSWGIWASGGYLLAAITAVLYRGSRGRDAALLTGAAGALTGPLAWLAIRAGDSRRPGRGSCRDAAAAARQPVPGVRAALGLAVLRSVPARDDRVRAVAGGGPSRRARRPEAVDHGHLRGAAHGRVRPRRPPIRHGVVPAAVTRRCAVPCSP